MIKEENISQLQKGVTFLDIITDKKIIIPKIQRDYAQGRKDKKATEIRDLFITAIIEVLTSGNNEPLVLDFVYGSTQNNTVFIPLDGQQRLTTLFLLYWYLVPSEELNLLHEKIGSTVYSRFTYETRITSKDFCNTLVAIPFASLNNEFKKQLSEIENKIAECNNNPDKGNSIILLEEVKKTLSLSKIIKDQSWFLWTWRKDPTIKAMLVMLDELYSRMGTHSEECVATMWDRLKNGAITFHLLPLEQFQLSDELYVKMNARGKALSPFDIFKSTLEEQMRLNEVDDEIQNVWQKNIDSNWIDLFWNKLAKPNINAETSLDKQLEYVNSVEKGYLRFLKRMMVFYLFTLDDCLQCDWEEEKIKRYVPFEYEPNKILNLLRDYSVRNDILDLVPLFCKANFFNNSFFKFVIDSFESIIYVPNEGKHDASDLIEDTYFETNPKSLFEAFVDEKITYDIRVQFYGVLSFCKHNSAKKISNNYTLQVEFNTWMRILRNLSTNTNTYFYNGYDDFLKSLIAINKWSTDVYDKELSSSINEYLKSGNKLDGFNGDQLVEEQIKARLILDDGWEKPIILAEEHKYFLGQIRFLLEWSKENENYNLKKFNDYFAKVSVVFDEKGLQPELINNHLFRNALMSSSNWYLFNNSFIQNSAKDRDWSWKRYLRNIDKSINLKLLLDKWDMSISFEYFCIKIINESKVSNWRKYFIKYPQIYDGLLHNKISWWNKEHKEICLLSKTRWSSKHKELRSYYLHLKYKRNSDHYLDSTHDSHPFSAIFRRDNNKEFSVKFVPKWNNEWVEGQYIVSTNFDSGIEEMTINDTNNRWERYVNSSQFDDVEKMIESLNSKYPL